jgi:hypothetical protein
VLPVIPAAGGPGDLQPVRFKTTSPGVRSVGGGSDGPPAWRVIEDVLAGTVTVETSQGGTSVLEDGRELYSAEALTMTASDDDPAHAAFDSSVVYRWREHAFAVEIRSHAAIRSDTEAFELTVSLEVDLDGERSHDRRQTERIPRRLV